MNVLIAEILVTINGICETTIDDEAKVKLEKLKESILDFIEEFLDDDFGESVKRISRSFQ